MPAQMQALHLQGLFSVQRASTKNPTLSIILLYRNPSYCNFNLQKTNIETLLKKTVQVENL